MATLASLLLPWFQETYRPLPWREEPTPYHVWISEIMLQQTRIEAVIPYYLRFIQELPTVAHLAGVPEDRLFKLWEGLGYYSRARNLKKAAGILMTEYGGVLPSDPEELEKLPGIGPYTAGAIASIAYGKPVPAVDGNVLRVMTRFLADGESMESPTLRRRIWEFLAKEYPTPGEECRRFTQALMAVGQKVCLPLGAPKCDACPLSGLCKARAAGTMLDYPVKAQKAPRRILAKTVFLFHYRGQYALRKREDTGLLAGLWEFPNLDATLSPEDALAVAEGYGLSPKSLVPLGEGKHIFTHLEWHMTGYLVECEEGADLLWASPEEIDREYALASAFSRFRKFAK